MSIPIAKNTVASFHYTLTDDGGRVLDSSKGRDPMPYLHGAGNIVPGLERQMLDHVAGDSFTATVPPAEGYGDKEDHQIPPVPRDAFPADAELHVGMQVMAQSPEGEQIPLWIVAFDDEHVTVDANHPLAGVTLHFAVEVTGVRKATREEIQHGHPHGADGHDHHH